MMAAMVCHGALTRHPDLRIGTIENGGTWVRPLLEEFEGLYKKMPQEFDEHPVETFKRNIYVNPFWEDELARLVELVGADRLLFGSDYPHPEGLADPVSYADDLPDDMPDADVAKIMGGNLAGLLGVAA
jgi:predicted TIM-barrel fold metal-dependent hydrolase